MKDSEASQRPTSTSPAAAIAELHEAIGRFVVNWNSAEATLRMLLRQTWLSGYLAEEPPGKPYLERLIGDLRLVAVNPALEPHLTGALEHLITFFERAAEFRHYVVHEIVGPFGLEETGGAVVFTRGERPAKGGGTVSRVGAIRTEHLLAGADHNRALGRFASDIFHHFARLIPNADLPPLEPAPQLPDGFVPPPDIAGGRKT